MLIKNVKQQEAVEEILKELPEQQRNSVQRKLTMKCSTWLTIVPTQNNGFAMSSTQFRDGDTEGLQLISRPIVMQMEKSSQSAMLSTVKKEVW